MAEMKLLPCPFCGSTKLETWANEISCEQCGARGPSQDGPECTTNPLIRDQEWNRRARPHALLEALDQCQRALSMMITPTQIEQTTTLQAFAIATEAEAKARDVISKAGA
jgi:hypothetical protein